MIQRQFWLIHQMQEDNSAYNIASVFRLTGPLDHKALEDSINDIVARHEILRTGFTSRKGVLFQEIHSQRPVHLLVEDIGSVHPDDQEKLMTQLLDQVVTLPFDLGKSPLLRLLLIRLDENRHVLAVVMHHIIVDLHSKRLFGSELSRRYNARTGGEQFSGGEAVHQYAEYARRQQEWIASSPARTMIEFWKDELKGFSGVLNLPTDFSRPAGLTYNGSHQDFVLNAEMTAELTDFSRKHTVDIFVTLLAAYLVLLSRYTNQLQIVVGVPLSNRRHADDKDTFGCFVNILPLAFDLTGTTNFEQALKQVRMKMLRAHRNQEAPFEAILSAINPKRDPSYNPIFQAGFTSEPYMELELNNLVAEPVRIHNKGAQLDLFLNLKHIGQEIYGYFEFNTDLFAPETIKRMGNHYRSLLSAVPSRADMHLNLLPLLSEDEKNQVVFRFNNTAVNIPESPLHQVIEEIAAAKPEAVAAVFGDTRLTYGQLNARANQVAALLRDMGVKPGHLIGVHLERSLDMLVAVYAILKAGAAYVPLDTEFPPHRISQMLEDSLPTVILTHEDLAGNLPSNQSQLLCMDRDRSRIDACPSSNPGNLNSPEDLAYVIFTSGSTGRPKGVQVPHRAVVNFLTSMQKEPGLTPQDSLLAVTTLSFDISVLELFLPLTVGAKVIIAASETTRDGKALLSLLRSSRATVIQATPTTFHLLIGAGWNSPLPVRVLCGGELFPHELARKLATLADSVWNMYGPTETTVWSTCFRITGDGPVLIGRPIANTEIYIVNDHNQPAPIGVAGELLIGGLGVTHGYLKRPDLTSQQFIPDMFKPESPTPVYRTGDLASYLPNGDIKILGRIDHQIKIRGFRIELGEIETALVSHPAVRQGVVKPYDFASGDTRLIAYVTLHEGEENVLLQPYLKEFLPDYMIPSVFTVLAEMPLTPNNKIDRKALPEPDRSRPELNREMVAPQNELEANLARKWSQTLHIDQVGIDDTFFDLGGNSLLSIQLIALLEEEMDIKIPVVKFYQYPTIRLFAQYLQQNQEEPATADVQAERIRRQQEALAKIRQRARG